MNAYRYFKALRGYGVEPSPARKLLDIGACVLCSVGECDPINVARSASVCAKVCLSSLLHSACRTVRGGGGLRGLQWLGFIACEGGCSCASLVCQSGEGISKQVIRSIASDTRRTHAFPVCSPNGKVRCACGLYFPSGKTAMTAWEEAFQIEQKVLSSRVVIEMYAYERVFSRAICDRQFLSCLRT
jgi:hypothetical protein